MNASVSAARMPSRKAVFRFGALSSLALLSLAMAFPSHALDLVAFAGIAGPLAPVLAQLAALSNGVKALVSFLSFVVAIISLAGLRNFGPVLSFLGMVIFAALGLTVAGAILGAVV